MSFQILFIALQREIRKYIKGKLKQNMEESYYSTYCQLMFWSFHQP
jgi:hypothetical protein